jgi:phage gp46-like protein
MSDLALIWDVHAADASVEANDLATDEGLETALILSLFTDRRANDDDELPDGTEDKRGWWGDAFPVVNGDKIGSRLWLLSREKELAVIPTRAMEYMAEATQWLIDDGVAVAVECLAEIKNVPGRLDLFVGVDRPTGNRIDYRFEYAWASQEARR